MKKKHCIYQYKNCVNGKLYIGQTDNLKRRIREHRSEAINQKNIHYDYLLPRAMRKYGEESFSITILEKDISSKDIDERERYWIKEKDSKVPKGYNVLDGGQAGFTTSRFNEDEISQIKKDIKSNMTYEDICKKWNITQGFVSGINHGYIFDDCEEKYPLCKKQDTCESERVQEVVRLLKETNLTLEQIAEKVGYSTKGSVTKINNGTYHFGASDSYPIRKTKAQKSILAAKLLVETDMSIDDISKEIGLSISSIRNIIKGTYRKYKQYSYPLR